MIIVGFKIIPGIENLSTLTVRGELFNNNKLLAEDTIVKPDSSGNNLGFDIPLSEGPFSYDEPLSIPEGKYRIVIRLFDAKNHLITQTEKELERNQIGRTFYGFDKVYNPPQYILINNAKTAGGVRLEAKDHNDKAEGKRLEAEGNRSEAKDYVIFQKKLFGESLSEYKARSI